MSGVGIGSLATTESFDDVHEATVELDPSLAAAGLLLLLLLLLHLRGLSLDLAGTSQRSVHFTSDQQHVVVQLDGGQVGDEVLGLQGRTLARQANVLGINAIDGSQFHLKERQGILVLSRHTAGGPDDVLLFCPLEYKRM